MSISVQVNNISGYLPGRIVFFLVCCQTQLLCHICLWRVCLSNQFFSSSIYIIQCSKIKHNTEVRSNTYKAIWLSIQVAVLIYDLCIILMQMHLNELRTCNGMLNVEEIPIILHVKGLKFEVHHLKCSELSFRFIILKY